MFLMSDAWRALSAAGTPLPFGDWQATTVLIVCHDWDPGVESAEALASRRLAQALIDRGATIHVLSANRAEHEPVSSRYAVTVVPSPPCPASRLRRAWEMVMTTVPEAEGAWVPHAVAAGRRLLASLPPSTVIYGRAMPGASNVVACLLATATGRPWVAHFSDPWPPGHVLANGRRWLAPYKAPLFAGWRRHLVRHAGAVTLTSPGHVPDILGSGAGALVRKTFVVTHLPSRQAAEADPPTGDLFHLVHTGNFYPFRHTSAALIEGLRRFIDRTPAAAGRVRLTQAGWSDGDMRHWAVQCGLGSVVRFTGRLGQAEVAALLREATLLVAVDYARPDSTAVLSKLPDYINARRPILAITAPTTSLSRLFVEDGAGLTARYDSPEQVAHRIGLVFDAWHQGRLGELLPRAPALESFTAGRVLNELAAAFAVARGHVHCRVPS